MSKEQSKLTPQEAKKAIQEDLKKRSDQCQDEISQILKKYKCEVEAITIIKNGVVPVQQIRIVAK